MQEQMIIQAGYAHAAAQLSSRLFDAVGLLQNDQYLGGKLVRAERPIPAEYVPKIRFSLQSARNHSLVRGRRDAGEAIIAGSQFAEEREQRVLAGHHSSRL